MITVVLHKASGVSPESTSTHPISLAGQPAGVYVYASVQVYGFNEDARHSEVTSSFRDFIKPQVMRWQLYAGSCPQVLCPLGKDMVHNIDPLLGPLNGGTRVTITLTRPIVQEVSTNRVASSMPLFSCATTPYGSLNALQVKCRFGTAQETDGSVGKDSTTLR